MHNSAFCNTDMHRDKHIIHVLMIHLMINCHSIYLPSCQCLFFQLQPLFFLLKSMKQLHGLLLVGTSPVTPLLGLSCVFYLYVCMCVTEKDRERKRRSERVQKEKERAGDLQSVNVSMSGCLGGCACEATKSFKLGKECRNARS